MALYQPTNISPSSLNGTGMIDATKDLTVTWQINGYGGMVGWQIQIMQNDAESTLVYDSTMLHKEYADSITGDVYYTKIFGKNENGDDVPFTCTIPASDLAGKVVNGYKNGYKLRINQQYTDYSNGFEYVTVVQNSPVFFRAEAAWEWNTYSWDSVETQREPQFFASKTSTGAPLMWHRWQLAGETTDTILQDTGRVYTDVSPVFTTKSLVDGGTYHIRLTGQDTDGVTADTGWFQFTVQYTLTANAHIRCRAYYVAGMPCTYVTLEADNDAYRDYQFSYYGWGVYRVKTGSPIMELAAIIPNGQYSFYDFGIRNNTEYTYEVYSNFIGNGAYHYTSNTVKMAQYWNWSLVEAVEKKYVFNHDGHDYPANIMNIYNTMYHVTKVYQFQGNIRSGNVSNDNSPYVGNNFTGYPIVQKSTRVGLSGTLKGLTGTVKNAAYTDDIEEIDDLMTMSSRETVKFLRDRKGNLRKVEIDAPIIKNTSDPNKEQAVEIQIPWVETGDAFECQVVSTLDDGLMLEQNDMTVGTDPYLYARILAPGEYKWNANEISGGTVTLTGVAYAEDPGGTSETLGTISGSHLSGTFTLSEVTNVYATGSAAAVTVTGFVLQKYADYEPVNPAPTPGEINVPQNVNGVQIAVLRPGMTYTWSYTDADFTSGSAPKLHLSYQILNQMTNSVQKDIYTVETGAQSGTFNTLWDADSVTLWLIKTSTDPVELSGWSLTGVSRGERPEIASTAYDYLLKENMEAGDWSYEFNNVTKGGLLYGQVTYLGDDNITHIVYQFEIGNTASGEFTTDRATDLRIYNPSQEEFTIQSYSLEKAEEPPEPVDPIVYNDDLTLQGNQVCGWMSTPGNSHLRFAANSMSGTDVVNDALLFNVVYEDGEKVGWYGKIWGGQTYTADINKTITRITIGMNTNALVPPYTLTNFTATDVVSGSVLFSNPLITFNYEELLEESIPGGTFSVSATGITGDANILFRTTNKVNWVNVAINSNTNGAQTVTIPDDETVEQIYVCCQYATECVLTGLKIERTESEA